LKTLILILLPFLSFSSIAQERDVPFSELSDTIKSQTDSAHFVSAYSVGDTLFVVESWIHGKRRSSQYRGRGRKRVQIDYARNGEKRCVYYYKEGSSPVMWCVFYGMAFYMGSKFIPR
jgi:hypothetical protein